MRELLAILVCGLATFAPAAVLYDAAEGTTPSEQGWAFVTNPFFGAQASQSVSQGVLTLDSSVASEQAGYFSQLPGLFEHPEVPKLDFSQYRYSIEFSMRLAKGTDTPDTDELSLGQRNRGGFAVIAIGEDLSGVELQFQTDNVLALDNANTAFPIGEVVSFNTTSASHHYQLTLGLDGYRLWIDGAELLMGPLRNYSSVAPAPPISFPYTTPSFLFFGDDTGRAGATTELTRFAVSIYGDCTYDDVLDHNDLTCVQDLGARDAVLDTIHSLPGDLDGDGEVGFADFLTLSAHFGSEQASYAEGNIDLQNGVTFADFLILSTHFGKETQSKINNVPEPQGWLILLVGFFGSRQRSEIVKK